MATLLGYRYRVKIVIDHTKVSSDLVNFPLLLNLTASSGISQTDLTRIFTELGSNNKRIAVTTSDGSSQCYVEIQGWNPTNKTAQLWVKVPAISSTTDTILYIYYDSQAADNIGYIGDRASSTGTNVWDGNFAGVWHLEEDPSGTAPQLKDSTSNNNNGSSLGMVSGDLIPAKVGNGLNFNGSNKTVTVPYNTSLHPISQVSISAWVYRSNWSTNFNDWEQIISKSASGNDQGYFLMGHASATSLSFAVITSGGWKSIDWDAGALASGWHFITCTFDGRYLKLYIDSLLKNTLDNSTTYTITYTYNNSLCFGVYPNNSDGSNNTRWFNGGLDEIRISSIARPAVWVAIDYYSTIDGLVKYIFPITLSQYTRNYITDAYQKQFIKLAITDRVAQDINTPFTENVSHFIKEPFTPEYTRYLHNCLNSGAVKCQIVHNLISDIKTTRQFLRGELSIFSDVINRYYTSVIDDSAILKPTWTWDIAIDGVSIKGEINRILVAKDKDSFETIRIFFADISKIGLYDPADNYGTERITLTINGTIYRFLIENISRREEFLNHTFIVEGRQKMALLTKMYSKRLTTVIVNRHASEIAAYLSGNIPIEWNCLDYFIPDFSMTGYPIDGIRILTDAAGGLVTSKPDGTVSIIKKFPKRPKELHDINTVLSLKNDRISSLEYQKVPGIFNSVTIYIQSHFEESGFDIEAVNNCNITGTAAIVKVYPARPGLDYEICATDGSITRLAQSSKETIIETIRIINGQGHATRPIYEIHKYSLSQYDKTNPAININPGDKIISLPDVRYGLLNITYGTVYDTWQVTCNKSTEVLVVLNEPGGVNSINLNMGNGLYPAPLINNKYIQSEGQAVEFGKSFLDDNNYSKEIYRIKTPYCTIKTGDIIGIEDSRLNGFIKGIVRDVAINISIDNGVTVILQTIEVHGYKEEERLV